MRTKIYIFSVLLFSIILTSCGIFEPKEEKGSMVIILRPDSRNTELQKTLEPLNSVQITLKKGSVTKYDSYLSKNGNYFEGRIQDLEPGSDYSVLLYGWTSSGDLLGRIYQSSISVIEGKETAVSLSWTRFQSYPYSPAIYSTTTDNTPYFDWLDVSDAVNYEIQVDNSDYFNHLDFWHNSLTNSNDTPESPLSDGWYYWRVRCRDSQGNWGAWSEIFSFGIDTQGPAAPTLYSPSNGSTTNDNTPYFDWSSVWDAYYYSIVVDNNSGFTSPEIQQSSLRYSYYTSSSALSDGMYYWKVQCRDSIGNWGNWSNTWSFTITSAIPSIWVASDSIDFGHVTIGNYADNHFDIYNTGNATLKVTSIHSSNYQFYVFSDTVFDLAAGGYYYIGVRFSPYSSGYKNGSLDIYNNSSVNPYKVRLTGFGVGDNVSLVDIDGNVYKTVVIGNQVWMAENLKVTHYRNGDPIPNVTDSTSWRNLNTGAYCNYNNDISYVSTYGRLYNWYAVNDSCNIAPAGWHVPSDEEWKTLEKYLGMSQSEADAVDWRGTNEGGKLKEVGTTHWNSPNTGATNESGFSALPGGWRNYDGTFFNVGYSVVFWSSTEYGADSAWYRFLYFDNAVAYRNSYFKQDGFSVRLLRD